MLFIFVKILLHIDIHTRLVCIGAGGTSAAYDTIDSCECMHAYVLLQAALPKRFHTKHIFKLDLRYDQVVSVYTVAKEWMTDATKKRKKDKKNVVYEMCLCVVVVYVWVYACVYAPICIHIFVLCVSLAHTVESLYTVSSMLITQ